MGSENPRRRGHADASPASTQRDINGSNGLPSRSLEDRGERCHARGLSLVFVANQARRPRLPWLRLRGVERSGECAQKPAHRGKPARGDCNNALPPKEERETLRPVVASATEPGTWLFPSGPRRRERCGLCLLRMATAGVHREEASTQRERQRRQQVSTDSSSVLPFLGGGVRRPVVFAAGVGHCPVLVCWRGRRNHCCTKRAARAQPAARQPTTRGRAAPPATGFPAPPQRNQGRLCSALLRVFPGTVCRGNPRTPCTGTEGRSAAAARLTALGYRNQSTVRRRRPILAIGPDGS